MSDVRKEAARAIYTVESFGYAATLVGGLAVGIRGGERREKDVDIIVSVKDDRDAMELGYRLDGRGYFAKELLENIRADRMGAVRFAVSGMPENFRVDLMFHTTGIEDRVIKNSTLAEVIKGFEVPVATRGDLIALKVLSVNEIRKKDLGDLQTLIGLATRSELLNAQASVNLIVKRGYSRDKNLREDLQHHIREYSRETVIDRTKGLGRGDEEF